MDHGQKDEAAEDKIKDNVLHNVSTAVKQLQAQCCNENADEEPRDFTGNMWQVQELCHHLDCALSHGLKIGGSGYWTFVRQLTHNSTVQLILAGLPRAVSNVTRGWAWLYIALNDRAMESYLNAILEQRGLASKHYRPHALLRDSQRLQVLITVSAGLEHLSFSLEPDTADLASWKSIVGNRMEANDDEGEQTDSAEEAEAAQLESRDDGELDEDDDDDDDPEIGVVSIVIFDPISGLPQEDIVHSSTRATIRRKKEKAARSPNVPPEHTDGHQPPSKSDEGSIQRESLLDFILKSDIDFTETDRLMETRMATEAVTVHEDPTSNGCDERDPVVSRVTLRRKDEHTATDRKSSAKRVSFDPDNMVSVLGAEGEVRRLSMSEREGPEGQEDPSMTTSLSSLNAPATDLESSSSCPRRSRRSRSPKSWIFPTGVDADLVKYTSDKLRDEIEAEVREAKKDVAAAAKGEVPLENNFHLMLMLEVVEDQEEAVYKVFSVSTGHTEGSPLECYAVLTDKRFYLTHWDSASQRYSVDASVHFTEIDFLQLSINYQIVNLVCTKPRRRYWLCTGNEEVTRNLVSSLEVSIRRYPQVTSLPCVFTDTTVQSIALSKWLSSETGLTTDSVTIDHYALVTWEDPHAAAVEKLTEDPSGPSREGYLMYRYTGGSEMEIASWRPGYFRLKAGVCYQFLEPSDRTFKSYVQLVRGGGTCTGCRRVQSADRPHAFELILTGDRSLQLAAPNDIEASEWLQVLLQTVSRGNEDDEQTTRSPCVSACLIQASQMLFVCHELLETHFVRCLAKAAVQDVSAVHVSRDDPYCILEFESVDAMDSSGDWVLHFSDHVEMNKFLGCLRPVWQELYQIPLPSTDIGDNVR